MMQVVLRITRCTLVQVILMNGKLSASFVYILLIYSPILGQSSEYTAGRYSIKSTN